MPDSISPEQLSELDQLDQQLDQRFERLLQRGRIAGFFGIGLSTGCAVFSLADGQVLAPVWMMITCGVFATGVLKDHMLMQERMMSRFWRSIAQAQMSHLPGRFK